jgi:CRP-like cAMP-binding protein
MDVSLNNFIHHLPVMAGLDEAALAFLGDMAVEQVFPAGANIVREGEAGDRVFFICSGRVSVRKAAEAPTMVKLAELGAGDFFGEMSLVESVTRSASVIAETPTCVYTLKALDFYKLYRHRPDQYGIVMLNIARDLSRRLRRQDELFCHVSH